MEHLTPKVSQLWSIIDQIVKAGLGCQDQLDKLFLRVLGRLLDWLLQSFFLIFLFFFCKRLFPNGSDFLNF